MIKFLAILILVIGMAYGAEEASKLSPADQAAIDKAIESSLNEPSKAYQAYQAALMKASEKAIKDLEKLKAGAMKGNNLPLATAIDEKLSDIKKGAIATMVESNVDSLLAEASNAPLKKWATGKVIVWEYKFDSVVLRKDGMAENQWKEPWTWTVENGSIIVYHKKKPSDTPKRIEFVKAGNIYKNVDYGEIK